MRQQSRLLRGQLRKAVHARILHRVALTICARPNNGSAEALTRPLCEQKMVAKSVIQPAAARVTIQNDRRADTPPRWSAAGSGRRNSPADSDRASRTTSRN
jgi:hypothetical protein